MGILSVVNKLELACFAAGSTSSFLFVPKCENVLLFSACLSIETISVIF